MFLIFYRDILYTNTSGRMQLSPFFVLWYRLERLARQTTMAINLFRVKYLPSVIKNSAHLLVMLRDVAVTFI